MDVDFVAPETRLWQAVIMQAAIDIRSNPLRSFQRIAVKDAIRWFERDGSDFTLVCSNANMCPRRVRGNALKLMKKTR